MNDEPIYPEAEFVYDPPLAFDRLSKFGMSETSRDALIFELMYNNRHHLLQVTTQYY